MAETKRQRLEKLRTQLDKEFNAILPLYRDLANYILPTRARFLSNKPENYADWKHSNIIDSSATLAVRTLRAGMMSGVTSPARPWFALGTPDPELNDYGPVKDWLYTVTSRMRTVFSRSNIYNVLPTLYGDKGVFGTAPIAVLEDADDIIRAQSFPVGSYRLALNSKLQVDTFLREYPMTVRQIISRWGDPNAGPNSRWDNFSSQVRNAWNNSNYEQIVWVVHVVRPNPDADPTKLAAKYKPVASCYYEKNGESGFNKFLSEGGFDDMPILAPRWEVTGEDTYGSSPGMVARGDVKALQVLQKTKAKVYAKQADPPLQGPASMRSKTVSTIPGDITYVDAQNLQQGGLRSIYDMQFDVRGVLEDIASHQDRISRAFYEDLFLMLAQSDRRQITATEVQERHEEKLLALGPVLERLNDELLDPLIDRTFNIMLRRGWIPTPPEELQNVDLKVEYISIMAQAQKMVGLSNIDRFLGTVGGIAQLAPDAMDKVDVDQIIDEYGDITGVPPKIIRSDEDVTAIRQERAARQQAAEQAAMAGEAAKSAKTLSETNVQDDNALTRLLGTRPGQAA